MLSEQNEQLPWIVGISGASGTVYARRLIQLLVDAYPQLQFEVVITESALRVIREEDGLSISANRITTEELIGIKSDRIRIHNNKNIGANIASGSYPTSGMIIVPCSMKSLAGIAHGYSDNLLQRAADVVLKEKRRLVLVPRETPLSEIHLENMLKLSRMGVSIVPPMPGFYHQPKSIEELVDMMVMRMIDQMGLCVDVAPRWGVEEDPRWRPIRSV